MTRQDLIGYVLGRSRRAAVASRQPAGAAKSPAQTLSLRPEPAPQVDAPAPQVAAPPHPCRSPAYKTSCADSEDAICELTLGRAPRCAGLRSASRKASFWLCKRPISAPDAQPLSHDRAVARPLQLLTREGPARGHPAARPARRCAHPLADPWQPAASELSGYLWDEGADANDLPAQRWGVVAAPGKPAIARCHRFNRSSRLERPSRARRCASIAPAQPRRIGRPAVPQRALRHRPHVKPGHAALSPHPRRSRRGTAQPCRLSCRPMPWSAAWPSAAPKATPPTSKKSLRSGVKGAPGHRPRPLYTVPDGTSATQVGEAALVRPCHELAATSRKVANSPPRSAISTTTATTACPPRSSCGPPPIPTPTAFLSVSHGEGAPGGFRSPAVSASARVRCVLATTGPRRGRRRSGSLSTKWPVADGRLLRRRHAAAQRVSAVDRTARPRGRNPELSRLLDGLPRPSEPPFVAALPQALLQNPSGRWPSSVTSIWPGPTALPISTPAPVPSPPRPLRRKRCAGLCAATASACAAVS